VGAWAFQIHVELENSSFFCLDVLVCRPQLRVERTTGAGIASCQEFGGGPYYLLDECCILKSIESSSFCWELHCAVVYFQVYLGCQHEPVELSMEKLGEAAVSSVSQGYSCI